MEKTCLLPGRGRVGVNLQLKRADGALAITLNNIESEETNLQFEKKVSAATITIYPQR